MDSNNNVSRRKFVGGAAAGAVAATLGYVTLRPGGLLSGGVAEGQAASAPVTPTASAAAAADEYDSLAKLANNENPYGPPESVINAMNSAAKYSNRYGYPDSGIVQAIADHHGVKPDNVLLGAGSGEILEVVGTTFLLGNKKVVGCDPSYGSVYQQATSIKADAVKIPLLSDYRQDIPGIIEATKDNYRDVGFVYMCNPNNPTGRIVTKTEIKQLLDSIPEDMPVLIDEAYHHFVDDRNYATSVPYILEGRPVIVARTFSKIAALAGVRIGYALARKDLIQRMTPFSTGTISAAARYGAVAALKDTDSQAHVKKVNIELRNKTTSELQNLGYSVIPSEGNFFMV
jgi:histidinol-phosphate aminotransferase